MCGADGKNPKVSVQCGESGKDGVVAAGTGTEGRDPGKAREGPQRFTGREGGGETRAAAEAGRGKN